MMSRDRILVPCCMFSGKRGDRSDEGRADGCAKKGETDGPRFLLMAAPLNCCWNPLVSDWLRWSFQLRIELAFKFFYGTSNFGLVGFTI